MPGRGTETEFELTTIERLEALEYLYQHGSELERSLDDVVLDDELRRFLAKTYPDLPPQALDEAVATIRRPEGVDTIRRNMAFHQMLVAGFELAVERPGGKRDHVHLYPIDWENRDNNRFLVVNQLPVRGKNDRRPDIVIYVNGLPLVVFELKNPGFEGFDQSRDRHLNSRRTHGSESQSGVMDSAGARKGQPPRSAGFSPGRGLPPSKTPAPHTRLTRLQIS